MSKRKKWKLWRLSRRYQTNSQKSKRRKKTKLPAKEFYIDQILCDDETEDEEVIYLVGWEGFRFPTWELATNIPSSVRIAYYKQGKVTFEEYNDLCNHLGFREVTRDSRMGAR
jgi:hypothetical protein